MHRGKRQPLPARPSPKPPRHRDIACSITTPPPQARSADDLETASSPWQAHATFAKDNLHGRLRRDRKALLWKLDGLSEYDARRPLTATGTTPRGLVKHVACVEARYFGEVFDRPSPEPLHRWQDYSANDPWATEDETRDQIIESYRRTWETRTRRSTSFPSTPPATCRGGGVACHVDRLDPGGLGGCGLLTLGSASTCRRKAFACACGAGE